MSKSNSFRVGKVTGYLRGRVWYLCYFENGKRRRPRAGGERDDARQLAAQVNSQLETGAPSALSFEPISIPNLRTRWLEHHEQVRRSSVQSIARYRTATDHLLRFLNEHPVRHAGQFTATHAAKFVAYLRTIRVSPHGHANTPTRPLLDKGVRYVLECCRALFNHAARRRHLPPYVENPFAAVEIDRIPVETARVIELLTPDQERAFLGACDDWQFPVFLTLLLTGLRPGELCHLLLPYDLDLAAGLIRVRNKPRLGWQVKTRSQRDVPLVPALADVFRLHLAGRTCGPVFRRRKWTDDGQRFDASSTAALERELTRRLTDQAATQGDPDRGARLRLAGGIWRDIGAVDENRVRIEFIRAARAAGLLGQTPPKVFRHQFATALQEGRVRSSSIAVNSFSSQPTPSCRTICAPKGARVTSFKTPSSRPTSPSTSSPVKPLENFVPGSAPSSRTSWACSAAGSQKLQRGTSVARCLRPRPRPVPQAPLRSPN